jgi:hypothetical protein
MPNTYAKYCPNVFVAKCNEEHAKGSIIEIENKYGKPAECEVHNLVLKSQGFFYYSFTRCDGLNRQTYAERKAEKYQAWAQSAHAKSGAYFEKSQEGRAFLSLGEPIKVGHHSEGRHRALIERNHKRMANCVEQSNKAESHEHKAQYWEHMAGKIDLSMPESIEYFEHKLAKATAIQQGMKDGSITRAHSFSLAYASKEVKDLTAKVTTAKKLWGTLQV